MQMTQSNVNPASPPPGASIATRIESTGPLICERNAGAISEQKRGPVELNIEAERAASRKKRARLTRGLQCGVGLVVGFMLWSCSVVDERKIAYRNVVTLPTLEVPPDLLSIDSKDELSAAVAPLGETVSLSEYSRGQQSRGATENTTPSATVGLVLGADMQVLRDGAQWWLNIPGKPGQSWEKLKAFWAQTGLDLQRENLELGVIETKWTENKAGVPMSSILRKAFESIYSNSTRDKFVMRLEPGLAPDTTDIFLTHRGMEQVAKDEGVNWFPRPSDPELEVEMLKRLAAYLGAPEEKANALAAQAAQANLSTIAVFDKGPEGQLSLTVNLDFARTWRRVGNALTRLEFALEDFDRGSGVYYVSGTVASQAEKGWFGSLFSDAETKEQTFKVRVRDEGSRCRVTVLNPAGEHDNSPTAQAFLERLEKELNR